MTLIKKLFWVDIILLIAGLICFASGYMLDFRIGLDIWGKRAIRDVHIWSSYVMTAFTVIHLIMHIGWLKNAGRQVLK